MQFVFTVEVSKHLKVFSSPERSAIVLSPASALMFVSVSANVKSFTLKNLGPHCFQTLLCIWFMFGMMADTVQNFMWFHPHPSAWPYGQNHTPRNFMLKFCIYVFTMSVFAKSSMDLIHIWLCDRYWSKILCSTIPSQYKTLRSRSQT